MTEKRKSTPEGVRAVVEMLAHLDVASRERLLADIESKDASLAKQIREGLFTFEDVSTLDPLQLQELLREVPQATVVLALRKSSEELRQRLYASMSERSARILQEELESSPPRRVSEVEAAQKQVIEAAKRIARRD